MVKSKDGWRFVIDFIGGQREAWADSISVTDAGWLKLWRKKQLVGVVKTGEWTRVYLDAKPGIQIRET